jgi:hypothetical protein
MKPWLIHIGYPKCGSTWMQKRLFPTLAGIEFLGKRYGAPGSGWVRQVRDGIIKTHCFDFCPKEIHALIQRQAGDAGGRPRLLSFEGLSGELWRGSNDSKRNADRLKATFPEARILIITRRQVAHLESIYKQYLLTGGVLPMAAFLHADTHHLQFRLDSLRYDRLVQHYLELYGRENVEVLPLEWLGANPQEFSNAICNFFGTDQVSLDSAAREYVRRGYSARECSVVRQLNRWRESTFVPLGFYRKPNVTTKSKLGRLNPYLWAGRLAGCLETLFGPGELLSAEEKLRLQEYYRRGDERLAALYPRLAAHGYADVPKAAAAVT